MVRNSPGEPPARWCVSCTDIKPIRAFPVSCVMQGVTHRRHICADCLQASQAARSRMVKKGNRICLQCNRELSMDDFPAANMAVDGTYYRRRVCKRCYQFQKRLRIRRVRIWVRLFKEKCG